MQPKKKTSKASKRARRSHHALRTPQVSYCPQCGEPRLPHRACGRCGYVNPRVKLTIEEES